MLVDYKIIVVVDSRVDGDNEVFHFDHKSGVEIEKVALREYLSRHSTTISEVLNLKGIFDNNIFIHRDRIVSIDIKRR